MFIRVRERNGSAEPVCRGRVVTTRPPVLSPALHLISNSLPGMARPRTQRRSRRSRAGARSGTPVFARTNYLLLLAGVLLVVIGYVIMALENEVDGFISLYIAPILILGGYLEIIYAILWRPKDQTAPSEA